MTTPCQIHFNDKNYHHQLILKDKICKHDKDTLIVHEQKFNLKVNNYCHILENNKEESVDNQYNHIINNNRRACNKIKATTNKHKKVTEETLKLIRGWTSIKPHKVVHNIETRINMLKVASVQTSETIEQD